MDHHDAEHSVESIAVVGMSGCFPGAKDLTQFWRNLCAGVESISFFSEEEHEQPFWADADAQYVRAKGVLEHAEWFDAAFFGYTPEEAMAMDPQHRLFLERGWEVIENAGYDAESYPGSIGVFAGVSTNTYLLASMFSGANTGRAWFTDKDFVTTRLSYKLNLRGPSLAVQTACSTSLVAVCQACQSLLNYQCDMAVAGGATVWAPKKSGYPYIPGGPVSPDGHCRAFADTANGFVPGSGVGAVLLKRLSEAVDDGDSILAVIKGFAVNNDGAAKIGYTAPSIDGQAEVIAMAQALAGVSPETISYIEAHGTGTDLGDPIEIAALTQVFRASTQKKGYCAVGSVKPNIGHLDAAAGIAGLLKAVLALKHRQLPPSINFERPNPKIDFASSPFYVNSKLADWQSSAQPRRAGVSAYGIGGTNAHVVLEEAPPAPAAEPSHPAQLLLLSARSAAALEEASQNLAEHLETHKDLDLADVAYTLHVGRKRFSHRRVVVSSDVASAIAALRAPPQRTEHRIEEATSRRVALMFPGQGSQYPGMAREVYEQESMFRDAVDRCSQVLRSELDIDLRQAIFSGADDAAAAERLMQTSLAQPAIFVIEYALAQLWMSWGIQPAACIGHSIGEYVAACLAGVFELDDALRLVAARARLMNRMPRGAMLAVQRSEEDLLPWLSQGVALAAVNGPALCVLSGPHAQIDSVERQLKEAGVGAIRLHASHAFHSAMMDPILAEFEGVVASVPRHAPQIPYASNLTGTWIKESQSTDPAYWSRHLRQTVRFSPGLQVLLEDQDLALLEVGPGRTLASLAQVHSACGRERVVATSMRHPQDTRGDRECLLQAAGQLWLSGAALDWPKLHEPHRRRRVALPTYPFQRQRYWACDEPADAGLMRTAAHARKNGPDDRFYVPSWKRTPAPDGAPQVAQQRWLVFADRAGLSARLIDLLAAGGGESIVVERGEGFAELSPTHYQIDPHSKNDYLRLVQELVRNDLLPDHIVHALCVTGPGHRFDRLGFYSLLYLGQALAEANVVSPMKVSVLTDGAQAVTGDEPICAEKALVQGPCRVLPQEFPHLTFQHVDVCLTEAGIDGLARLLLSEIASDASDQAVAYRHGYRWTQAYEQTSLPASSDDAALPIRQAGVYLITGGLGGIGLVLANWLARTAQAKLVLTSRSARRGSAIETLEASGAEVLVLPADVCDEQQMQQVVQQVRERFGPIQGVLHAAGIAGGGVVQLKTREMAERVLAPKVDGLRVLQRVLREEPLEFFALCSSTAALAGGFGQIDYCAANAFLDAAAWESRAAGGPPMLAINWNAWREVGMAVETQLPTGLQDVRRQIGLEDSLSNADGADAFQRILTRREPQVAVSTTNLPEVLRKQREQKPQDLSLLQGAPGVRHARPELATPFEDPITDTERATAEIWQTLFGFDCVGRRDDFFELGGHSLLALQLLEKLRLRFGVNLSLPNLFEQRTIAELSQRIDSLLWASGEPDAGADTEREEITL